ncbi:MAG: RagB/SusD family nutrient uptake outer membrane protein, partial [Bacteroidales bacterium]|nr:RagB/SusD family nutrient uptake outer membrane protein [Bacteroidales bacterium]
MKNTFKNIIFGALCFGMLSVNSCDEGEFLKELPLDFYSPENSYVTYENYQGAVTDLYARVRGIHFNFNETNNFVHYLGTDIAQNARGDNNRLGNYADWFRPEQDLFSYHWNEWYKIITNANTILSRLDGSKMTDAQKAEVAAEAKFFRGFAYRYLGTFLV